MTRFVTRCLPGAAVAMLLVAGGSDARAGLKPNWEESGQASWYGRGFEGQRTTSGAIFHENALTAAHDTLPLGTKLVVTTQETGRSVVVTVTDRMPPKKTRIIDVSRAAAKQLGLIGRGVGMVTLTEARPAALDTPVEVAEATDDEPALSPRRHDRRHMRRGVQTVSARHAYYRARSATLAPR